MLTNFNILASGGSPPQKNLPTLRDNEEILLFAAWIHGMSVGNAAHRLALFSFVQSHISNKAEETLQNVIENSRFWKRVRSAVYTLNQTGYSRMINVFGPNSGIVSLNNEYEFKRNYNGRTFSAVVYPIGKIETKIDGTKVSGASACRTLENQGADFRVKSSSRTRRLLNWIIQDDNYSWQILNYQPVTPQTITPPQKDNGQDNIVASEEDEEVFPEGKEIYRLHRTRERNPAVVKRAKEKGLKTDPLLRCQICGFSFVETYGKLGMGFIEAHHTLPLSELSKETETKVEDIALVCSNCHKMLHKRRPWLQIDELKQIIELK